MTKDKVILIMEEGFNLAERALHIGYKCAERYMPNNYKMWSQAALEVELARVAIARQNARAALDKEMP